MRATRELRDLREGCVRHLRDVARRCVTWPLRGAFAGPRAGSRAGAWPRAGPRAVTSRFGIPGGSLFALVSEELQEPPVDLGGQLRRHEARRQPRLGRVQVRHEDLDVRMDELTVDLDRTAPFDAGHPGGVEHAMAHGELAEELAAELALAPALLLPSLPDLLAELTRCHGVLLTCAPPATSNRPTASVRLHN